MRFARTGAIALGTVLAAATAASAFAGGSLAPSALAAKAPAALDIAALDAAPHVPVGVNRLARAGIAVGIATFDATPDAAALAPLRRLGLTVQPMKHLPLAIVQGPVAALRAAVASGAARDVYPDERVQLLDTASSDAMGAAAARMHDPAYTGAGVTVAVVDSGCDASHKDLADHVAHNVKLIGKEYLNQPPDPYVPGDGALVVPIELLPYRNSDLGSGHGTHVSGIVAADGSTGDDHFGVAPDATLICYSIGEVLFTTAVISAYDHMLDQPDLWGIDVVNNSWGNLYTQYDPANPVNVATKAVADRGVVVVFAAGNAGTDHGEASLNPWAMPPWVISVAAGDLDHNRAYFSSDGLEYDNSTPVGIGASGHTVFTGDRIGMYHPDVTAPGYNISSTCDSLGTVVGPCLPNSNASASGTSMASPHIAGAAAVLKGANPKLTVHQVRVALQVTATPLADESPFWEAGYGYADLGAAVRLVTRADWRDRLETLQEKRDRAVLGSRAYAVRRSDFWTWTPPAAAVGGATDSRTFTVPVSHKTSAVKVTIGHPSTVNADGNFMEYDVTLRDAAGTVVATTTELSGTGTATAFVDLSTLAARAAFGDWTVEVSGTEAASDPDTLDSDSALGDSITLQVAQLARQ